MRGSDVACSDAGGFHLVTRIGEPGDNDVQAPPNESKDVFDEYAARAEFADDAEVLEPEPAALSGEPFAFASEGDIGAWEASHDEIRGSESCSRRADAPDVFMPHDLRAVLREHRSAKGINLDLPGARERNARVVECHLDAAIEQANAREE